MLVAATDQIKSKDSIPYIEGGEGSFISVSEFSGMMYYALWIIEIDH